MSKATNYDISISGIPATISRTLYEKDKSVIVARGADGNDYQWIHFGDGTRSKVFNRSRSTFKKSMAEYRKRRTRR